VKPADTVPAAAAPWAQTASGKALPLGRAIEPGQLDIRRDIAVPLGLSCRFAGQMPTGVLYSVAQHCVIGADHLWSQTQDVRLAMAFLCHEAHEGPLGDWTSPVINAMQAELDAMRRELGDVSGPRLSIAALKKRLAEPIDRYVHAEAGLTWPLPPMIRDRVRFVDVQMLMTERAHLLAHPPRAWDSEHVKPIALKQRIKPLTSARASEAWIIRFERWSSQLHADRAQGRLSIEDAAMRTREAAQ
jgi:hypothetical protein